MWCLSQTLDHVPIVVSCTTGQYHDIALSTGQYLVYCPGSGFDLNHRWDTKCNNDSIDMKMTLITKLLVHISLILEDV